MGGLDAAASITYHGGILPRMADLAVQLGPLPVDASSQIPDVELTILNLRTAWPGYNVIIMGTRSGATGDLTNEDITRQEVTLPDPSSVLALAIGIAGLSGFGLRRRMSKRQGSR